MRFGSRLSYPRSIPTIYVARPGVASRSRMWNNVGHAQNLQGYLIFLQDLVTSKQLPSLVYFKKLKKYPKDRIPYCQCGDHKL